MTAAGCAKCGATDIPVIGHEPCPGRDDVASGEVWEPEIHWASCDGLCGEPGGCWDDDYDPENPPHDGWDNLVLQ